MSGTANSRIAKTCNQCDNWFEEPEEENEYEARMEENTMEEKADARRKYEE